MLHYHHIDGGMSKADKVRFLTGRHGLASYVYKGDIAEAFALCQSVILDNGAFTIWRQGGTLDPSGYVEWCYQWHRHPGFDWALIPDVIDGNEAENDALLAEWPRDIRGVPVWHMHESIDRLERLCCDFETVALGSSGVWSEPGTAAWWVRIGQAMDAVCDDEGRPLVRLHGLRMLDPMIFTRLPLASADSMSAVRRANDVRRFGMYPPPTPAGRSVVVADRIEHFNSAPAWSRLNQQELFAA